MKKLYVGNVPFQATEQDLSDLFAEAGVTVDSVTLVRDRHTDQPRGFGFVEISDDDAALNAINSVNGKDLLGRALVVNEARPRREGDRGFGRGRGGGGGGGRGRFGRGRRDW